MSRPGSTSRDDEARWLMADLLQWHRREAKPDWWMYFERRNRYQDNDFVTDSETLGGLVLEGAVGPIARSMIWRYRFDPTQDHGFSVGDKVFDPAALRLNVGVAKEAKVPEQAGTVIAIDNVIGTIDLKRSKVPVSHPSALMPGKPITTEELELSLQRVARALLTHGVDGPGPTRAARRLLGQSLPRFTGSSVDRSALRRPELTLLENSAQLVETLDESVLAIQGPPGTGKTYTAARVILGLIAQGKKVGISAFTHSAIRTLIAECVSAADELGQPVSILQQVSDVEQASPLSPVTVTTAPAATVAGLDDADLVAGTAWLFAREEMADRVDVLIVDEAGQLSLANVMAIAPAARSLVLVGDPQQLAQPSKVTHPDGAGLSALEHLLQGRATISDDRGLLLDETRRLHPSISTYISEQFYDGRLTSHPSCSVQSLTAGPCVNDHGLKFHPVPHEGNRTSSTEEAVAIAEIINDLVGGTWVDEHGVSSPLTTDDILVITPFNAQVVELSRHLPAGVTIGTVDKMQGREAAVAIISMASSTAADAPRGLEFLFSRNRLNVAVSRAKVMAILVANPGLPSAKCNSIEQMKLVNSLCRYVELAAPI